MRNRLTLLLLAPCCGGLSLPPLPPLDRPAELVATHGFSGAANWLVPGHVMLGANPTKGRGSAVERLRALRRDAAVTTFVSLQEMSEERDGGYADDARSVLVDAPAPAFARYEIQDLRPAPSLEWLADTVGELAARVRAGEVLYVHCFAGRGRAGLVGASLLGELYEGVGGDEALERVGAYYRLRAGYDVASSRAQDGRSPETEPQRQQVRDFLAR